MKSYILSLDIGASASCVCSVNSSNPNDIKLNVNQASNRQTPTVIAFRDNEMIFAEEAEGSLATLADNAATMLSVVMGLNDKQCSQFAADNCLYYSPNIVEIDNLPAIAVQFAGSETKIPMTELLFFYIRNLLEVPLLEYPQEIEYELIISVPTNASDAYIQDLGKSISYLKGIKRAWAVSESYASLHRWSKAQLPDYMNNFTESHLGFLDIGFSSTTFSITKVAKLISEDGAYSYQLCIIGEQTIPFGTLTMIKSISELVAKKFEFEIDKLPYKKRITLFKACNKCLKDLSISDHAKVEIECFLNEDDLLCPITREQLTEEGNNLIDNTVTNLIKGVLKTANMETVDNIELIGGGSRVPLVQKLLGKFIADGNKFRHTIHNKSCIAHGSILALLPPDENIVITKSDNSVKEIVLVPLSDEAKERIDKIYNVHMEHKKKVNMLNALESRILEIRNHKSGDFSDLISDEMNPLIDQLESWTWDSLNDPSVTLTNIEEKLDSFEKNLEKTSPRYIEEINRKHEEKRNREMEMSDDTTLTKEQLLKRAAKNKQEGNELYADGNIELSIQRYIKSLGYCTKVVDPTEAQLHEMNDIKYACHLNLAQCYLRFDSEQAYNKAKKSCESALSIKQTAKAYFKISIAYEKLKDFDKSMDSIKKAMELENNKTFSDRAALLNRFIQARKEKEKKVYSKMFA
ncbi:Heat shock protein homolog SSE1 [Babesia microti strain RI]|uniref:Heat shock protein homolog SSE1 n=1 Tax=Babesia microti (strain RI) TaxID=1133968 RepID=A0A1R4AB07_BABMR|nr:Heat shock protein homolog SSE1 [Babesia microti strain RI]SJK86181.1 Heat shock protein homolog SSE1 [Babesia microti strain RI]|eukprot:XP_021338372.1 Heat shock protein homolog SSE1 [Babesia microti strain RI]